MSAKLFERTDSSGLVTTAVFKEQAAFPSSHFFDLATTVDPDMVVVGGGATAAEGPNGALLTASYPTDDRAAWLASSKDHRVPNPHRLTGFAVGMRINSPFMSRTRLLSHMRYLRGTSAREGHPRLRVEVPSGFTMISGGFRVNWPPGPGNLATGSFPGDTDNTSDWSARSKDHIAVSPATIDVWAVAVQTDLELGGRRFRVDRRISRATGNQLVPHATAEASLEGSHVLTGIGAKCRVENPGQLLWRLEPTAGGRPGVTGSSKDHQQTQLSIITVTALGIRLLPN